MKPKVLILALFASVFTGSLFAQDRTTVNATSYEISDNLDLKAVASIFGDSKDLEDFERRLNDPKIQISNLDLNRDNQVDYLRVIESVEGNTHLIIIQSVLERDVFQDVATVEVEKDRHNNVQVQVVGDVYMYGNNYIYEPIYVHTPVFYNYFWSTAYRPYYSSWYWGYYPTYYYAWNPYPIYRYRNNIHTHINIHNHYNYVNIRRSERAASLYNSRRNNGYERQYPERSFSQRNNGVTNRYELAQARDTQNNGSRSNVAATTRGDRSQAMNTNNAQIRSSVTADSRPVSATVRSNTTTAPTRIGTSTDNSTRAATSPRNTNVTTSTRPSQPASVGAVAPRVRAEAPRSISQTRSATPAITQRSQQATQQRAYAPRIATQTRSAAPVNIARTSSPSARSISGAVSAQRGAVQERSTRR